MVKHREFIEHVVDKIRSDDNVMGLAVAGSFLTNEMDDYADVDLVLVTANRVAPDKEKMIAYANSFGDLLNGFTGEHVGDRRVLICLYDNPLLHVDIKFLTVDEFYVRVEDPVILWDRNDILKGIIATTKSEWPQLDYQWIEDRFWIWVHYAASKLGRGENFEALDFLSFVRVTVIAPLLQVKNARLPRGLRKVEFYFNDGDLKKLVDTVPAYSVESIFSSLYSAITSYQELRRSLYPAAIILRTWTEKRSLEYLSQIKKEKSV